MAMRRIDRTRRAEYIPRSWQKIPVLRLISLRDVKVFERAAFVRNSPRERSAVWLWPPLPCARLVVAAAFCLQPTAALLQQTREPPEVQVSAGIYNPPTTTFSAQANLVPLTVVVRDAHGQPIVGLARDQFHLFDDGEARPITFFQSLTPLSSQNAGQKRAPSQASQRDIALYFDDVTTAPGDFAHTRIAAAQFVAAMGADDRLAIFTASSTISYGLTNDRTPLLAAIAAMGLHPRASPSISPCPRITPYEAYLISQRRDAWATKAVLSEAAACQRQRYGAILPAEYVLGVADATWDQYRGLAIDNLSALQGVVDYLATAPGRRVLIFASGGFVSGTTENLQDDIIRAALRAGVTISALDAKGLYANDPLLSFDDPSTTGFLPQSTYIFEQTSQTDQYAAESAAMSNLAQATGGLFFHNNNDLTAGFKRLGLDPSFSYQIAFAPPSLPADGKLHTLRMQLRPDISGASLEFRRGYFDPPPPEPAAKLQAALDHALTNASITNASANQVAASVRCRASGIQIRTELRLDVQRLRLNVRNHRRTQRLIMVAALYDHAGRFITGKRGEMDLALKPATWEKYKAEGLGASLNLIAPGEGTYQVRVVIGEAERAQLSAYSVPIVVSAQN